MMAGVVGRQEINEKKVKQEDKGLTRTSYGPFRAQS